MIFDWITPLWSLLSGDATLATRDFADIAMINAHGIRCRRVQLIGDKWVFDVSRVDEAAAIEIMEGSHARI